MPEPGAARWFRIGGRVQGVGFRPFVQRLATQHALTGWVRNAGGEVHIRAQGLRAALDEFARLLSVAEPHAAAGRMLEVRAVAADSNREFRIDPSVPGPMRDADVPADLAICEDCRAELHDPAARRFRYPFINCTQCGPRYTLIHGLPYDRPATTMAGFSLCADCAADYADPHDRRFHAQPLACAACGPALMWTTAGEQIVGNEAALDAAVRALAAERIIAVRGVGGYHLICDAWSEAAVATLRLRKGRPAKPLAVMVPWDGHDGLDAARSLVRLAPSEASALTDAARPIVLLDRLRSARLAEGVAPGLRRIGVMLPYSPLHDLLLAGVGHALVVTSGNVRGEPVLTEPAAATDRLGGIADGFLHHDRPIARPAEDPIVHFVASALRHGRLGRGTAPLALELATEIGMPTLAVGAYLKITVALAWDRRAVVSPHIGDLGSPRGRAAFGRMIEDLQSLYGVPAVCVAHDAHPDFPGTRWARDCGLVPIAVWHHHAHASAVAGEFPGETPLLCFTWDGTGFGEDGSLWGGEALLGEPGHWRRVASFRPFRLPGGERAAREGWRAALALAWECGVSWPAGEVRAAGLLRQAFEANLKVATTTSVGRLFDAAAALLGITMSSSYEGEGAMRLESAAEQGAEASAVEPARELALARDPEGVWRTDWAGLLVDLLDARCSVPLRAARFHATLATALHGQALRVREDTGVRRVGLCGGVFQNRMLTEQVHALLTASGFEVLIPCRVPCNDAGISFGQLVEAAAVQRDGRARVSQAARHG